MVPFLKLTSTVSPHIPNIYDGVALAFIISVPHLCTLSRHKFTLTLDPEPTQDETLTPFVKAYFVLEAAKFRNTSQVDSSAASLRWHTSFEPIPASSYSLRVSYLRFVCPSRNFFAHRTKHFPQWPSLTRKVSPFVQTLHAINSSRES
jgi:hypothetical protein